MQPDRRLGAAASCVSSACGRMQIIPFCSPGVHGLALGRLAVTVSDGIVSVSGRVECRSAIPRLVRGIQEVEGVIVVDQSIAYDIDDRYPIMPASF